MENKTNKVENNMENKCVIVRGDRSGVFAGNLESQEGPGHPACCKAD